MVNSYTKASATSSMGWGDVAIIQEEKLALSSLIGAGNADDEAPLPVLIRTSDDSCGSDSDNEESFNVESAVSESLDTATTIKVSARSVQFSSVQVREYAVTIGDHPMCGMYPLSLDWAFVGSEPVTMDQYEENRKLSVVAPTVKGIARVPRLATMQRFSRLVEVTGYDNQELHLFELTRQALVNEDRRRAVIGLAPVIV